MFPGLTTPLLGCLTVLSLVMILGVIYTLSWLVGERAFPFLVAATLAALCLVVYAFSKIVRRM